MQTLCVETKINDVYAMLFVLLDNLFLLFSFLSFFNEKKAGIASF